MSLTKNTFFLNCGKRLKCTLLFPIVMTVRIKKIITPVQHWKNTGNEFFLLFFKSRYEFTVLHETVFGTLKLTHHRNDDTWLSTRYINIYYTIFGFVPIACKLLYIFSRFLTFIAHRVKTVRGFNFKHFSFPWYNFSFDSHLVLIWSNQYNSMGSCFY